MEKERIKEDLDDRGIVFGIAPNNEGVIKLNDVVDYVHNLVQNHGVIGNVIGWLTVEECAKLYGQKVKCKWLTPSGDDWLDKELNVGHGFLKDMEQGSIKEAYL